MKLTNILITSSLIIPLSTIPLKADTVIETDNGIKVETNSQQGLTISTPNRKVNSSGTITIKKNGEIISNQNSSSSGSSCSQGNVQSSKVGGSNRTVVQSSTLNCD